MVFYTFFIENRCPSQAKSMFLLKALIFFFLLRGLSPLDPGAHWPDVLRSSSSWMSQIYLDRLHSQMDNGHNHAEYESGVYQWWIGQNRSVFFWKSRHSVRSERKLMNIITSLIHFLHFKQICNLTSRASDFVQYYLRAGQL